MMSNSEKHKLYKNLAGTFALRDGKSDDDFVELSQLYGKTAPVVATKILNIMKQFEDLTYAEANASLQIVHEWLEFESNFVKIN